MFKQAVDRQLQAKIRTTEKLIEVEGRMITLVRPPEAEDDGAGGRIVPHGGAVTPMPPVRRYFGGKINNRMNNMPFEGANSVGEYLRVKSILVGMPGDDIKENDTFAVDGLTYHVEFVYPDQTFEVRADCMHVNT